MVSILNLSCRETSSKENLKNGKSFEERDDLKYKKQFNSIIVPLVKAFGPSFMLGALFKFGYDLLQFLSPEILRLLYLLCSKYLSLIF